MYFNIVVFSNCRVFRFNLTELSLSFLATLIIKNKNAQSGVSNVLSLGLCFISGVFVPQSLLSSGVLTIASFMPTYWFIKANNEIGLLTNFTIENLSSILTAMLIQIGFAVALVSIALVIIKKRPVNI